MKDQNFHIKVSDLLKRAGQTDEVIFEHKFSNWVENLTKNWINWKIILRSLDKDSVSVTLENVSCQVDDVCDICWKEFERGILIDNYEAKFIIPEDKPVKWEKDIQQEENEIFEIDPKSELIDVKEMINQSVILQEPLVKKCDKCKKLESEDDKNFNEEQNLEYFEAKDNIKFTNI